jgi:hypothetical protein
MLEGRILGTERMGGCANKFRALLEGLDAMGCRFRRGITGWRGFRGGSCIVANRRNPASTIGNPAPALRYPNCSSCRVQQFF